MPAPILSIPLDDAAFQRFLKTFAKYQDALKTQPEMWKGINEGVGAVAAAGAAMTAEIVDSIKATSALAAEEQKREDAIKKARRADEEAEKAKRKADEAEVRRRKKAIEQVKEYSRGLAEAAVQMGKWALFGGGASIAAGALSFWGLDRFVAGVGQERRLSQGLGVSMGQRQGMGLNMQRYFDVNSTLETVANAQADPSQWGVLKMMGLDPRGKDPAQLTGEAAIAARRMFIGDKQNLALAQAQGLTQIFSPDDLRRLAATPLKELQASIGTSNRFAKNNGLSDEVGRKWQDFTIKMDTAGLAIKNKLVDRLTVLEQPLGKVIDSFSTLVLNVLTPMNLKGMADGIETFAKYIGDGRFQADFKHFIEDVSAVASKLAAALTWLGIIPDRNAPAGNPTSVDQGGNWWNSTNPKDWGNPSGRRGGSSQAVAPVGGFFKRMGWSTAQAAGVTANLDAESNLNPFAKGDGGHAYGIGQWHEDRQARYSRLFGHSMQSVKDYRQALSEQLRFVQWELTHTEKKAGDALKKEYAAAGAAYVISTQYERPKDRAGEARKRGHSAVAIELKLQNQTGASVATTTNSAAN